MMPFNTSTSDNEMKPDISRVRAKAVCSNESVKTLVCDPIGLIVHRADDRRAGARVQLMQRV